MASQADLVKIGMEGFATIDKYYGRPRRPGRPYYPPGYPYTSQFPHMKSLLTMATCQVATFQAKLSVGFIAKLNSSTDEGKRCI